MERPEIAIKLKSIDWLLELIIMLVVIVTWVIAIIGYKRLSAIDYTLLPAKHSTPNASMPVIIACLATFIYGILSLMSTSPNTFNYPITITIENAKMEYTNALIFLRMVKLAICSVMMLFAYCMM